MQGLQAGALALVMVLFVAGCSKPCPTGMGMDIDDKAVAATVNGQVITLGDLNAAAKDQLARINTEIFRLKKMVLDGLVEEELIAEAAKKQGQSVEDYLNAEIIDKLKASTDEEMRALYDARKGAIKQSFEEIKPQIEQYLKQNGVATAKADLIARLKEGANIKISLEPPRVKIDTAGAPTIGDEGAKITLVEFSDYQCPFCRRARPTIWRIVDEYKDKIRYVFMDFPLSFHQESKKAHEAARCAGDQAKYFEYNRKLFDEQSDLGQEKLMAFARELKLDMKEFQECLENGKYAEGVEASIKKGIEAGVAGTPAFYINGIMLSGAMPYESFKELIDAELNR